MLYQKAGHMDNILSSVKRVSEADRKFEGLVEIGAWLDIEKSARFFSDKFI
jgi:hypothetical protein